MKNRHNKTDPKQNRKKRRSASEFIALWRIPILGKEKTAPKLI